MKPKYTSLIVAFIAVLAVASCNKPDWDATIPCETSAKATSNEITIAGKSFIMDELRLELSDFKLSGDRLQGAPVSLVISSAVSTNFISGTFSDALLFEIPIGTYTSMELNSKLNSSSGASLKITGTYYLANGNTHDVAIRMTIDQDLFLQLPDPDGSATILLEEGTSRQICLSIDTEVLFSDINQGLWNAAAVTSINGSATLTVDELNNKDIYDAINAQIVASITAQFL